MKIMWLVLVSLHCNLSFIYFFIRGLYDVCCERTYLAVLQLLEHGEDDGLQNGHQSVR